MFYLKAKVKKINKDTVELVFDRDLRGYPGQFVMLNVPGYEEIPISLSSPNTLTIKAVGETTRAIVEGKICKFGIRGPFGRAFSLPAPNSQVILVAGGIGIAPLNYLYLWLKKAKAKAGVGVKVKENQTQIQVFYGAKTSEDIVYTYPEIKIATDDGSKGYKGNVVQLAESVFKKLRRKEKEKGNCKGNCNVNLQVYVCGPPLMMKGMYNLLEKYNMLESSEFSMEGYMRCGIGVCGSCVLDNGLRVCRDGAVFRGTELSGCF